MQSREKQSWQKLAAIGELSLDAKSWRRATFYLAPHLTEVFKGSEIKRNPSADPYLPLPPDYSGVVTHVRAFSDSASPETRPFSTKGKKKAWHTLSAHAPCDP